jgi:hypothetical protein
MDWNKLGRDWFFNRQDMCSRNLRCDRLAVARNQGASGETIRPAEADILQFPKVKLVWWIAGVLFSTLDCIYLQCMARRL